MKVIQSYCLVAMIGISLAMASCESEVANQDPVIHFLSPDDNLVITKDTVLHIEVEASDPDGTILKVEMLINDSIISTFSAPPYTFHWQGATIENSGLYTIRGIAYDNFNSQAEDEINIEIRDVRIPYLGKFNFKIIKETWMLGQPTTYDTSFYDGLIRKFIPEDSEHDLCSYDNPDEDPNEKITIEFQEGTKITSILRENGDLVPKGCPHYSHFGGFPGLDTIAFQINGLGGLGGGRNYEVLGIRNQ